MMAGVILMMVMWYPECHSIFHFLTVIHQLNSLLHLHIAESRSFPLVSNNVDWEYVFKLQLTYSYSYTCILQNDQYEIRAFKIYLSSQILFHECVRNLFPQCLSHWFTTCQLRTIFMMTVCDCMGVTPATYVCMSITAICN